MTAAPPPERWPRVVLHADMDAFYAAVEQLDHPELRGLPVIVGGPGRRGVVTTASYEARPFGVHSAMPMFQALERCPQAVVVRPRFERYSQISSEIMKIFADFSPKVEAVSLDEAFLEMTGAEGIFGSPADMGRRLKTAVREATGGLTISVGAATTKFLAKVASDFKKPDGLTVVEPGTERTFLDPLPVSRLWGVGVRTEPRLLAIGLRTIGDVARADPVWLLRELGSLGPHLHRLAHNQDWRRVVSSHAAKSIGAESTLPENIRGAEAIRPHLLAAADTVAARLRKYRLLAFGVRVKLKTTDFQLHTRQTQLEEPTSHADTLFAAAMALLPRFDLDEPVRLVGLAAFDILQPDEPRQGDLFGSAAAEPAKRLDRALDEVRSRFGKSALHRASDDWRPTDEMADGIGVWRDDIVSPTKPR